MFGMFKAKAKEENGYAEGDDIGRILAAKNAFEVLDIPVCPVAPAVVKRIYRRMALKVHPDKNGSDERAEGAFKVLTAAHELLSEERSQRDALQLVRDSERDAAAEAMRQTRSRREAGRRAAEDAEAARVEAARAQDKRDAEMRSQHRKEAVKQKEKAKADRARRDEAQRLADERETAEREAIEKEVRRREKKELARARRRLRVAFYGLNDDDEEETPVSGVTEDQLEELCGWLLTCDDLEQATMQLLSTGLMDQLARTYDATAASKAAEAAREHLDALDRRAKIRAAEDAERQVRLRLEEWSAAEDDSLLRSAAKAGGAPPPSVCARASQLSQPLAQVSWAAVSDHHNTALRRDILRSAEDCRDRYKHLVKQLNKPPDPPPASSEEWTRDDQVRLEAALTAHPNNNPADPKERWRKVAAQLGDKTPKQCLTRYKELAAAVKAAKQKK